MKRCWLSCPFVAACSMCASSELHLHSQLSHSGCIITHNWLMFASFFQLYSWQICIIATFPPFHTQLYAYKWHARKWIGLLTFSKFFLRQSLNFFEDKTKKNSWALITMQTSDWKWKKCNIFQPTLCYGLSFALSLDAEALKYRKISFEFQARPR